MKENVMETYLSLSGKIDKICQKAFGENCRFYRQGKKEIDERFEKAREEVKKS